MKFYWQRLQIWLISITIFIILSNNGADSLSQRVKNCLLPMISGRCFGYVPSYAYDPMKRSCVEFIYGGCGGNKNRFSSKSECDFVCRDV